VLFSSVELARPQARREPVARFLVLASDLAWPDVQAQLKIKACNVLFPGQATVDDAAFETTFTIPRRVPNPLPLLSVDDYKYLIENALNQQKPAVKIIIKEVVRAAPVRPHICCRHSY
jgi:hypothetical protein